MPSGDFRWWPDEDVVAVISWWRQQPAVNRPNGPIEVGTLGKVLDRQDLIPIDIARRIDHDAPRETAPEPAPTAAYGAFIGKLCQGCHGETLAGGPIPGAPPDMPVPSNLTPHETGLASWSKEDFYRVLDEGINKDGKKLDPMMPVATLKAMNETEREALWAYLQKLPAKPFGER
jgi:mono/diheme cytochrome c family protein